jgi:opacity protein-like surface antigen
MRLKLILAVLLLSTALPALAQVVPQATSFSLPFYAGGGYSRFSPDYGPGRTIDGINAYAGFTLYNAPFHLTGLGVEAEWRSIFFNQSKGITYDINDVSETTMGGGINYKILHFQRFHPYGKFLLEHGKQTYHLNPTEFATDKVYVMGGGAEYRAWHNIWLRGDYSYEDWPNLFSLNQNSNPVGVTLGLTYDFHGMGGKY